MTTCLQWRNRQTSKGLTCKVAIWSYKVDCEGNVRKILVSETIRPRGEERPPFSFNETILKAYYAQECEKGSRFHSAYPKSVIKRVHETQIERERAGLT